MIIKMCDGDKSLHELLLTARQKTELRNAFDNNMDAGIKFSKARISKIIQSSGFLGALLSKIYISSSVGKKYFSIIRSDISSTSNRCMNSLIISNEEMNDITKIIQALQDSGVLLKSITKTIEIEAKGQKGGFLGILLGTLGAGLLRNMLAHKGIVSAGYRNKWKVIVRPDYGSKMDF